MMNHKDNPLLTASDLPFRAVPFDRINAQLLEEAFVEGLRLHENEIDSIATNPQPPTFENTIVALDRSGKKLNETVLTLGNLESALGSEDLMTAVTRITPKLSEHSTGILLNEMLWNRIREVYEKRKDDNSLTPEDRRLLSETYRSFAESGAMLEGEKRDKYRKLNTELSHLSVKFGQNIINEMSNADKRMWISEEGTAGLPSSIKLAARAAAKDALESEGKEDDPSKYLITLFAPSYIPFMKYASDRGLRERLYRLYNSRNNGGRYDNILILKDIVNIRLEIANLMGWDSYAGLHLQGTMARTPENVYDLLGNLKKAYNVPMQEEIAEITEFARRSEGREFRLMPWDYSYWAEKLKSELYSFSDEDMKPYFELENTINGVLGLATKLYGYTFNPNNELPVYHKDVKVYEVYERDGGILGILYADFFYRDGKSPGAWMTEFRTETRDDSGNRELPLISIVCNFSKPVGDKPVLLTPNEVNTFLHEFGHALHGLSAQAKYVSLSGTNVYHDFVELFSQFNENYLTENEFLDSFARHYESGDRMPECLIHRFVKSRQFGAAYACIRQLGFAYLDMAYHTLREPLRASGSVAEFERDVQGEVKVFDPVDGCLISPSFGHIFSGGYAAGYYGYKWSEVLDADAFAEFKTHGIFDSATAERFKRMLQGGGTADPMELYIEFRGKRPTVDALLERDGIRN